MDHAFDSRIRSTEKPIGSRFFLGLVVLLLSATSARAQRSTGGLTEAAVVRMALERASVTDVVEGEIEAERGRARSARAYPNPEIAYMREQTFGALGTGEDYLSIAQTIDLAGRRRLRGEAGDARARAARHEGEALRLAVAADARSRFYEVLYRSARVAAVVDWRGRVDEALAIVGRRERAGDAAPYDRIRLEREASVARGSLEMENAALERARAGLEAIMGEPVPAELVGALLPAEDLPALSALRATTASRPDLVALELRIDAATLDARSASRGLVPDLRLEAGWKGIDLGAQGRTDGFLLGASLVIPLWDASSGLERAARGEARAAQGRRGLLEAELEGELRGIHGEVVRLRAAAALSRSETMHASQEVVRIATRGYEGGELGLLELLDAYRGAADDALSTLDMEHRARTARIALDRITGRGTP